MAHMTFRGVASRPLLVIKIDGMGGENRIQVRTQFAMYDIQEQVLIVYSLAGTQGTDLTEAKNAIANYSHAASNLRMSARVFEIPGGAGAGTTLGAELTRELRTSLGAVVFADDLRPNVVYELGFFHGRGARVLLLTRRPIDTFWLEISDLAG